MTNDELRKIFDLKPCPNPGHEFKFGRLMGEWRRAADCWSQLVGDKLQTLWFSIHTTKSTDNLTIYCLTVWKLKVIVGVV
jgi:hypothetical protein